MTKDDAAETAGGTGDEKHFWVCKGLLERVIGLFRFGDWVVW